jgi:DNA-binding beta-propeller fold protein YncE
MGFLRNLFTKKQQDSTSKIDSSKKEIRDIKYILQWGRYGTSEGQFSRNPNNVATDSHNNVYVAEVGNVLDPRTARLTGYISRIQKFDASGNFLESWGSYGEGVGQFAHVGGIAVDIKGYVYVTAKGRVLKFDAKGNFVMEWGKKGTGEGEFGGQFGDIPRGLDVDNNGYVYVIDRHNNRIQKFDNNGKFITKIGNYGNGENQFGDPFDVAVDAENGFIYITDTQNKRIQKLDTDFKFIAQWEISDPSGIAVDRNHNVYVTAGQCVHIFDVNGTFIAKLGQFGKGEGEFDRPEGVAVDMLNNVYVADYNNHRIQKFG